MNPESLTTFDRRGARAVGSQPAPLLVLARCERPENHNNQNKNKKPFTRFSLQNPLPRLPQFLF
jgi:hypothetical protein